MRVYGAFAVIRIGRIVDNMDSTMYSDIWGERLLDTLRDRDMGALNITLRQTVTANILVTEQNLARRTQPAVLTLSAGPARCEPTENLLCIDKIRMWSNCKTIAAGAVNEFCLIAQNVWVSIHKVVVTRRIECMHGRQKAVVASKGYVTRF